VCRICPYLDKTERTQHSAIALEIVGILLFAIPVRVSIFDALKIKAATGFVL
jgi:hypothetical protein